LLERASGRFGIFVRPQPTAQGTGAGCLWRFRRAAARLAATKSRAQEQIARRVATEKQFRGSDDEFRAKRAAFSSTGQSFRRLRSKVADGSS